MKLPWSNSDGFGSGTRSMGKTEYLLGAALAIVIIGSVVLSIYFASGGGSEKPVLPPNHYFCEKCNTEFAYDFRLPSEGGPPSSVNRLGGRFLDPRRGEVGIDCPNCKATASAFIMNRCPKCMAYWPMTAQERDPRMGGSIKRICPKCGTDPVEFYKEKYSK